MGPSSAWTRCRASTPRPPGGAQTARPPTRPPAPGPYRLADPFAPSEETKYTFVSHRARVRVLRRTVAGRRVRGPRARLAASGRQPLRGPGVPQRKRAAARGRAGLTAHPEQATRGGQNPHRLLPGRGASPAAAVACALLFLGFRQGGKRASGSPRRGRASPGPRAGGFGSAEPPLIRPPPLAALGHPRLHSEGTSRNSSWTLVAKRQPGPRAGRWEYYKSQQAPRRERRSGRRGPA